MSITQTQEVLTIRGKVQMDSLAINDAAESETAAWNDNEASVGVYYMWSSTNCHLLHKVAAGGTAAGDTTGMLLLANNPVSIRIWKGDVIAARAITGSGTIKFIHLNSTDAF